MTTPSVLYITYDGICDHIGQSQVLPYLQGLANLGHRIAVLSVEKKHRLDSIPGLRKQLRERGISWDFVTYRRKPPFLATLWVLFRLWRTAVRLVREKGVGAVHCRSDIPSLIALRLRRLTGIKFIFDPRDFYADSLVAAGRLDVDRSLIHRVIYKFLKGKEREFIEHADHIISLTEAGKRVITGWESQGEMKVSAPITVIPCCADFKLFDPSRLDRERVAELRFRLGIAADAFVLIYLGSLGRVYLMSEMLDFFQALQERRPNARFLVASNNDPASVVAAAAAKGLDPTSIIFTHGDRAEVPYLIAQANLGVCFIAPTFSKKACSPTKLAELLAMNVPVVGNAGVGDLKDILTLELNASTVITQFAKEEYLLTIDRVLGNLGNIVPKIRERCAALSLDTGVNAYHKVYREMGV